MTARPGLRHPQGCSAHIQASGVLIFGACEPDSEEMRRSSQRTELCCCAGVRPVAGGVRETLQNVESICMSQSASDRAGKA